MLALLGPQSSVPPPAYRRAHSPRKGAIRCPGEGQCRLGPGSASCPRITMPEWARGHECWSGGPPPLPNQRISKAVAPPQSFARCRVCLVTREASAERLRLVRPQGASKRLSGWSWGFSSINGQRKHLEISLTCRL